MHFCGEEDRVMILDEELIGEPRWMDGDVSVSLDPRRGSRS